MIEGIRDSQHYKVPVWFYSGTVFKISPEDLVGMVEILESDEWNQDETLKLCTSEEVRRLAKDFKKGTSSLSEEAEHNIVIGTGKLLSTLMIARTTSTSWFKKPLPILNGR